MSTLRLNAQGEVLLCCGGKGCPVLKQTDNDRVSIKDDFGNEIDISLDEAKLIAEAIELKEE